MISQLEVKDFLKKASDLPVLDVRSPKEYEAGHIPGAVSFPLFTDEERKKVGTAYKQVSREDALLIGLDFFGPKMSGFVKLAKELAPEKEVLLHCWRGGMRSGGVAWLLDLAGFHVKLLQAGYKSYRRSVLDQFEKPYPLILIGGMTGSGKTDVLPYLQKAGEQVINLEKLARHKGSSFGSIGMPPQPSIEQFENELAQELTAIDADRPVWLEHESITIGRISLPKTFYDQMSRATVIRLDVPKEVRVRKLAEEYCKVNPLLLEQAILRIQKRLGGLATKEALQAIQVGDMEKMVNIALIYYDQTYQYELQKKPISCILPLPLSGTDPEENAQRILAFIKKQKV